MRDIRSLDLNLLKTLDALLDERSVTRAASRLSLTQPAVSGMLTRLRDGFDDPLFIRTQHGMVPTTRALELAEPVKRVLGEVEALLQPRAFDPPNARFTLTIAATDYALSAVLVPFLSALRTRAPGINVLVRPLLTKQLAAQLERGEVDVALTTPETTPPEAHSRLLFEEHYVCIMRSDHPDAVAELSLDRFCALDHALVSPAGSFDGVTDTALAALGRRRRVALSVASFLVLPRILRTSDLIAVVPSRLLRDAEGLALCEPPVAVPGFAKLVTWHERTHRDPGRCWARTLLADTCVTLD